MSRHQLWLRISGANHPGGALMARGVSTKLLTQLPEEYSADWLERIDKRTKIWRAILPRIQRLEEDAGGADNMTHAKAVPMPPCGVPRASVRDAGASLHCWRACRRRRLYAGVQFDGGRVTACSGLSGDSGL
jgi:hypothetical protein